MNNSDLESFNQLNKSLKGRLRIKLYSVIAKEPNLIPDIKLINNFLIDSVSEKTFLGLLFMNILKLNECMAIQYEKLLKPVDIDEVLLKLEKEPLKDM